MDIDKYIVAFFQNKIHLEEYAELKRWFNTSEKNKAYFRETILILKATALKKEYQEFDAEKAWAKLEKQYSAASKKRTTYFLPLVAASISLLLVATGGLTGYFLANHENMAKVKSYSIETPAESRSNITLADGSTIQMNAGSKIQYDSNFGDKIREITFEGEGFFEIQTDASRPFRVKLPEHTIEVLGTKFNLKSYQNDDLVQIALLEGSVRIIEAPETEQPIYLKPSEQYKYNKRRFGHTIEQVKPGNIATWTTGKLFFDNQSLKDIINQLERVYNQTILIQSETLQNKMFYSDFDVNQPLEDILKILSAGDKFKYTIHSTHIELYN